MPGRLERFKLSLSFSLSLRDSVASRDICSVWNVQLCVHCHLVHFFSISVSEQLTRLSVFVSFVVFHIFSSRICFICYLRRPMIEFECSSFDVSASSVNLLPVHLYTERFSHRPFPCARPSARSRSSCPALFSTLALSSLSLLSVLARSLAR